MSSNTKPESSKSGVGVGSASIVLIFAVLCLTIFSLITYIVARNDKALVDAETALVEGFYSADALAERVLSEILSAEALPAEAHGVDIITAFDEGLGKEAASFYCPVSDAKALFVNISVNDDSYDILDWRMVDLDEWVSDDSINIWIGE